MSNALCKTLAVFLCLTMCLSLFPAAGFAEDYLEEELLLESDYTDEPAISDMEEVVIEEKAVEEEILEEDFVFDDVTNAELREPEEIVAPVEPIEQESLPEANAGENGTVVEELDEAAVFADPEPSASEVYTALVAACAANYEGEYNLEGSGEIEITDNLSIPVNMHVRGYGFKIIVPSGVTLTVYGEFNVRELLVQQGGEVVVDSIYQPENFSAHMDIPHAITVLGELRVINHSIIDTGIDVWKSLDLTKVTCSNYGQFFTHYEATTELELQNSYADILNNNLNTRSDMEPFVEIRFPFEAGQNTVTSVPAHTRLRARQGAYIPQGVTFTVSERAILAVIGDNLVVDGALVNNGRINLHDSSLIFGLTGEYSQGEHAIVYNGENITIDTSASEAYTALRDACAANYEGEYDLTGLGRIVIAQSLSIPVNMHVRGYGCGIVIPDGVTLTVYGEFNVSGLLIQEGGKVVVNGEQQPTNSGAHMDIPYAIMLEGELELINRGSIDTGMNVWKDLDKSKITYNQGGFCTHYEVTTVEELQAAYNDIVDNHLNTYENMEPFVEVRFPFEAQIPGVPTHTRVRTHDGAHIPQGVTFTVLEGGIFAIFNENLVVDGALVNNGRINLNGPIAVLGETGSYDEGENGGMYRNGGRFTFKTNAELLTELEQSIENDEYYELTNYGDFVLTNGATFEHKFFLRNYGTNFILPAGQTLRVKSGVSVDMNCLIVEEGAQVVIEDGASLSVYDFLEGDGRVTFGNDVWANLPAGYTPSLDYGVRCHINVDYEANNLQELYAYKEEAEALEDPFYGWMSIWFNWRITDEITFDRVELRLDGKNSNNNYSITVADGGKLTLNSGIWVRCTDLTVDGGTLINNSWIELCNDGNGETGVLGVNNGGVYDGSGEIIVRDIFEGDPDDHIDGIYGLIRSDYYEGAYLYNNAATVPSDQRLAPVLEAIKNGASTCNINNYGTIMITEDLTIPGNLSVSARNDGIFITDGATLTVYGELLADAVVIEDGGKLVVDASVGRGHVDAPKNFMIQGTGSVTLNDERSMIDCSYDSWLELDLSKVTFNGGAIGVHFDTDNEQDVVKAYQRIQADGLNEYTMMEPFIEMFFPFECDMVTETLPHTRLRAHNGVHIPAGKTFTVSSNSVFAFFDANLNIDGTLLNNGLVNLNGPYAFLGATGTYTPGEGARIMRNGQPYTFRTRADLLAELEQAVANGDNYFNLAGMGDFELTNGLTIPSGQRFRLECWGTNLTLPAGKTVRVEAGARFELHTLIVEEGASVIVEDGGYLNVYDFFELTGTLTAGNNVRLHIPAETDRTKITLGDYCNINVHFRPENEQQLRDMLAFAEGMEEPYHPDIQPQFPWELHSEITFNRVHLTINRNRGGLVIGSGGVLTLNGGLYCDGALITIEGDGRLINNSLLELDENGGVRGRLQVNDGGVYTGSGVMVVLNVDSSEEAVSYITGLNLSSFSINYIEDDHVVVFVDSGAVLTGLRNAIANHESYYNMNNLGPVSLGENETLMIPEGMHVSAWGTTLVVPAGATLNVIGDYSGTGLELYGQLLMGKGEVDWERENSNVNIRDHLVFGENAEASVGLQANLGLPGYALTDAVIKNQINRVHYTSWVHLNWNAYDADDINDAITRTPTLPDGFNGHADIRFPWVINGTVEIPSGLNLFVDGAYDNGSITISEGATLISNDFINLNAAPMTVYGTLTNNNCVEVNYDSGDRYAGYGTINFAQNSVYTGNGDLRVPNDDNAGQLITGLNLSLFEASDDYGYTSYRKTGEIWEAFATACSQSYDNYSGYNLSNLNSFTLQDDITIPQNMDVDFWNTNLIIPAGKTLTVNGGLHGHQLTVNGQLVLFDCDCYIDTVTVGDNGHVTLHDWANLHTEWYNSPSLFFNNNKVTFEIQNPENHTEIRFLADASDDTEFSILMNNFNALEDHYYGKIRIEYDKVLTSNLNTEAHGVQLEVRESLTVNPGVILRTDYLDLIGGNMNVNGTLFSNQEIHLQPDNDRGVPTGTITFAKDASYVSENGWFFVSDTDNPDSHIQGLNMDRFDITRYSNRDVGYHVKDSEEPIEYAADLVISSETLRRGDQVTVSVSLDKGIGAKMAQFKVRYDSSVLRLVSCAAGDLMTGKRQPTINDNNPGAVTFVWADTAHALNDAGTLLNLTFEEAAVGYNGSTEIFFASDYNNFFKVERNEANILMNFVPGSVNIMDITLGDVDNDGFINVVDVFAVLEHAVKINLLEGAAFTAADVTRDGSVNAIDANIISRYVAELINEF